MGGRGRNLCLLPQVLVKKFRLHPEGDRTPSEVLLHEIRYKKLTFYKSYSACRVDYWLSGSKTLAAGRPIWKFLQLSKWEMLHWNGEKGNLETWKNNVEQSKQTKNSYQTKHKDRGASTISEPPPHHHISTPVVSLRKVATISTGREGKFHFYELIYLATSPKAPANTSVSQAWTLELWVLWTLNSSTLL